MYLETSLGISDYTTAIRKAVRNLADKGITGADYISATGRRTRNHIDVAVRRAVVTSTSQTAGKMQIQRAKEWGSNLVEVTSHSGARPDHAKWQGRIYSLEGETKEYPNLYKVTDYGSVTGLKGANCSHDFYPHFPGLSRQRYQPIDEAENAKVYEQSQQQRKLERDVREQKRRILAADEIGDAEGKAAAQMKLKAKEAELKSFTQATGRTRRTNRQQVMDFGHSQASQAVWEDNRAYSQHMRERGLEIAPKNVAKHRRLQYTNPPEYELQQKYLRSVDTGMLSPLSGYDNYKNLHTRVEKELVGATTVNGIVVSGQSDHFMERVIGTMSDPTHGGRSRSGVDVESIKKALRNGTPHTVKMTPDRKTGNLSPSQRFSTDACDVTINPATGALIQCNRA